MKLDEIARRNALRFPRKTAVRQGDVQRSWAELDLRVDRVANALRGRGLAEGSLVAILLGNCIEYLEIYLGAARAGLVAVPLNYRLTPPEVARILERAHPSLFVFGSSFRENAESILSLLPAVEHVWVVGEPDATTSAEPYEQALDNAADPRFPSTADDRSTFAIFFTSGTTGLPKGAMVSHRNLVANAYNQFVADESRAEDVNLVATPLHHMGAVFMSVTYMMLGCTQVILESFDAGRWLESVERERVSVALLVPTMINSVLNHPGLAHTDLSSLRRLFYGGGPMHPSVLRRALERLRCGFTQGYGLTETLEATFLTASDHVVDGTEQQQRRLASAGREAVGAEVRIVDPDGNDVPAEGVGEVLVRSESVISGYWRMPDETAATIRDGWFHTGDLGYLDEDRYLFIVDRLKDMVVSGGVNIYTKEIEAVLYEHPAVLEAAVIGVPDEQWGEAVAAVVVRRPGATVDAEALVSHCRRSLASYKKPRVVRFVDELPKNASGKILKRRLRTLLAGEGAAADATDPVAGERNR